jgi:hypothetical protein
VTGLGGKLVASTIAIGGPEQRSDNDDFRWVLNEVITYAVNDKLSLAFDAVYGQEDINMREKFSSFTGYALSRECFEWWGAAIYAKYQWQPHFSTALRAEYFSDVGGSRLGQGASGVDLLPEPIGTRNSVDVMGLTLSMQFDNIWKNLTPRLELRYDKISEPVYSAGKEHSIFTASFDMIYVF